MVLAVRRAPEGVDAPRYNEADEWRPWSVAPLDEAQGPVSPSDLYRNMPEVYQISPVTNGNVG